MQITFAPAASDAAILILPVEKDGLARADWASVGEGARAIGEAAAGAARFAGEAGKTVELFAQHAGAVRHVLLVGTGGGSEADWTKAGGAVTAKLLTSGATAATAVLSGTSAENVACFAAAAQQRAWRFDEYRTKLADTAKPTFAALRIVGAPDNSEAAWARQEAIGAGVALTKQLVTLPPNILYPESFVERVRADVDGLGLEISVLGEDEMRDLGMGSLLAVSLGSRREAQLLVLRWQGAGEGDPAVALVGKGVTFDTGGISIKPAAGMEDMKWDMGGAGAVVGAMKAIAGRKAKANVVGVCGLVENMPDGNATRPGDVVTSMSGQTIEVLNTDAEGRLVLADAITWVQRTHRPGTIVDLATLTGDRKSTRLNSSHR